MPLDSLPVTVKEWSRGYLGLVRITYLVEDRRPDIPAELYPDKWKHHITVRVLWWTYAWVFRTRYSYDELPYER